MALALVLGLGTGCGPGSQRMVPVDGRQVLPGEPMTTQPSWRADELLTNEERTHALEQDFARRIADSDATGGFLVVTLDGEVLVQKGFGQSEPDGAAVTDETLFLLASVSKVFLALSALSLDREGRIDLDAPLADHVSDVDPEVTLRLALSHRAGVPDSSSCEEDLPTPTAWAEAHAADELWSPPGALFNYSNGGFALAGAALERAMTARLPEVVTETVFAPANAETATYERSGGDAPRAVGQYSGGPMPSGTGCGLIEAAGGTWASARDLAALLHALLGETDAFEPALLDELMTAQTSVSGGGRVEYGHGLFIEKYDGELVLYHLGGLPWFGAGLLFVPSRRFGVAFAVNAGNFMPFLHDAAALYLGAELERTPRMPDLSRLHEYGGLWRDPAGLLGEFRIEVSDHDLTLVPLGEHALWPLPVDGTFWPDEDGEMRYFATRLGVAVKQPIALPDE